METRPDSRRTAIGPAFARSCATHLADQVPQHQSGKQAPACPDKVRLATARLAAPAEADQPAIMLPVTSTAARTFSSVSCSIASRGPIKHERVGPHPGDADRNLGLRDQIAVFTFISAPRQIGGTMQFRRITKEEASSHRWSP